MPEQHLNSDDTQFIDELVSDRKKFDDYLYFADIEDALVELKRRREDKGLQAKVEEYLAEVGIPEPFRHEPRLTLFRQLATPNIEVSRFLIIADGVEMKPLFLEYFDDKFTSNNEWKLYLGKLAFYEGVGKKGGDKINYKTIIDFNTYNGDPIKDVQTLWGESLVDFHHRLFDVNYSHHAKDFFYDGSDWFHRCGGKAELYYRYVLALFICHGILFENLILSDESELNFGKNAFIPAFRFMIEKFGVKPIIVPISPTEIESAEFWFCQNPKTQLWFKQNHDRI